MNFGGQMIDNLRVKLIYVLVAIITLFFSTLNAQAAEIKIIAEGADNKPAIVLISGEFNTRDDKAFTRLVLQIDDAVIIFTSPGGDLGSGISIGKAIRLKQYATLVLRNDACASACALAWLGGTRRLMQPGSQVGFHAAYKNQDGALKESGVGNALVGSYLNQLGLPDRAVAYITSPAPESIQWLSFEDALQIGIDVSKFEPDPVETQKIPQIASRNYTISDGIDLFGFDLPNMPLNDMALSSCQLKCNEQPNCKAFTFNRKSSTCFLKSDATLEVGYEYAVAGYLPDLGANIKQSHIRIHQRTDVKSQDYDHLESATMEDCIRKCDGDDKCRAFSYIPKKRQCWLKSSFGSLVSKKGVVSGLK
jgi:hypothetical protein